MSGLTGHKTIICSATAAYLEIVCIWFRLFLFFFQKHERCLSIFAVFKREKDQKRSFWSYRKTTTRIELLGCTNFANGRGCIYNISMLETLILQYLFKSTTEWEEQIYQAFFLSRLRGALDVVWVKLCNQLSKFCAPFPLLAIPMGTHKTQRNADYFYKYFKTNLWTNKLVLISLFKLLDTAWLYWLVLWKMRNIHYFDGFWTNNFIFSFCSRVNIE